MVFKKNNYQRPLVEKLPGESEEAEE